MKKLKTEHQKRIEARDKLMPELVAFENKHGLVARAAMRHHLLLTSQREQREREIKELEKQLAKIKKGKAINPYE